MPHTCHFAILRFLPYRETGEFVNVGVVLHCPEANFFDVLVERQKRRRVTDFFPELDPAAFTLGRRTFLTELLRVKGLIQDAPNRLDPGARAGIFHEMVRPRESMFHFGELGTALADDPAAKLREIFDRVVNRQFAQPRDYQETLMARRLVDTLKLHHLLGQFRQNIRVGNDTFHVVLPIVSDAKDDRGIAKKAIKPLDLDRPEPTKIYDHGDMWINRVDRLRRADQLPGEMLFAIREPSQDERRVRACQEICGELRGRGIQLVAMGDERRLLEFARIDGRSDAAIH